LIGKFAGLRQAIHALVDFDIDMTLVDERMELVVFNDLVRQDSHGDAHVGIICGQHGVPK